MLTRSQMQAALKRTGGSILLPDGRRITKEANLPPPEELARFDPEQAPEVEQELRRSLADLTQRLQAFDPGAVAARGPVEGSEAGRLRAENERLKRELEEARAGRTAESPAPGDFTAAEPDESSPVPATGAADPVSSDIAPAEEPSESRRGRRGFGRS